MGLALLMGISVLGIVTAQFLWIRQSLKVQQEQLETSAYIAINRTVKRVEHEQSAAFMLNPFLQNPSLIPSSPFPPMPLPGGNGGGTSRFEAHINLNGKEYSHSFDIDHNGSATRKRPSLKEALSQMGDSVSQIISEMEESNNDMLETFKEMARELESSRNPMIHSLGFSDIAKILEQELNHMGVKIPVEYAIMDNSSDMMTDYHSKGFRIKAGNEIQELKVPMFPNRFFRMWSDLELRVQMPVTWLIIVRTQTLLLGVSALFTIIILGTFFFTMRTIIHQKKVSDIKNDFINNMTHEFKTPIATISLATDSIATPSILEKPDVVKSFLSIIKEENSRMNTQVERILQMALIDKKDFSIMKAPTPINKLVEKAIQNMSLFINESGGNIELNLMPEDAEVNLDMVHFTNVVMNLTENAIKYSGSSPKVIITTAKEKENIKLTIRDHGIGMTKEQQNKIFEKFFRATGGNIHNVKGFGLGLSYVKAVVDAHEATIRVRSKPGEGTEFCITLAT